MNGFSDKEMIQMILDGQGKIQTQIDGRFLVRATVHGGKVDRVRDRAGLCGGGGKIILIGRGT